MSKQSAAAKVFITNRVVLSMADDIMYTLAAIYHITYFGLNPLDLRRNWRGTYWCYFLAL